MIAELSCAALIAVGVFQIAWALLAPGQAAVAPRGDSPRVTSRRYVPLRARRARHLS